MSNCYQQCMLPSWIAQQFIGQLVPVIRIIDTNDYFYMVFEELKMQSTKILFNYKIAIAVTVRFISFLIPGMGKATRGNIVYRIA